VLLGEYQHSVDEKGRLTIPSRLREGLGERFVVTKGLDSCLFVYPLAEWNALETKLRALPLTRPEARSVVRLFFSGAIECELDRQGRILLPPNLRSHARLVKDAYIIGVSNRVEIWDKETWEEYSQQAAASFEQAAAHLDDLGI